LTVEKAKIYIEDQGEPIEVLFNPREYSISQQADYGTSGNSGTEPQFNGFKFLPFNVSLFFDTYAEQVDVRDKFTDKIARLTEPIVEGTENNRPPECIFSWGSFAIKGVIEKVDQKFTMFLKNGIPVRAEITITFNPVAASREVNDLIWEACRKHFIVKSGDRLDLIAHRMLKNPALWRKIATVNNITDPLEFPEDDHIGTVIIIPE
jgi:hypothetical protein